MTATDVTARQIGRILVGRGRKELEASPRVPTYTQDRLANALVADLRNYPHAFVVGCIMDRQIKAERAWEIPYRIQERLGSFEFRKLRRLSVAQVTRLLRRPTPIHRYPPTMGKNMHAALALIADKYGGDASQIWKGRHPAQRLCCDSWSFRESGRRLRPWPPIFWPESTRYRSAITTRSMCR
jgi:hypothetical protein